MRARSRWTPEGQASPRWLRRYSRGRRALVPWIVFLALLAAATLHACYGACQKDFCYPDEVAQRSRSFSRSVSSTRPPQITHSL